LLKACRNQSVLDLGCAEGVIARAFLDAGASLVHGFDIDEGRTLEAERLCNDARARFRPGNLNDWDAFSTANGDMLLPAYDIVLYLGLHQHLNPAARMTALAGAARRARVWFAIRTPEQHMERDDLRAVLEREGFELHHAQDGFANMGPLFLFKRRSG
jgi:hypothetical protein